VIKNNNKFKLCVINCFSDGYLIDVSVWDSELLLEKLTNLWVMFEGFRVKKLANWKMILVSSVYSKIAVYEVIPAGLQYTPFTQYHNLSSIL
jgi:hypothetical protein